MKFKDKSHLPAWFPQLNSQIWILALGRFLSEIGSGFTLFYAPIFFVKQVGLSATEVGFALGSASISGVVGRILAGSLSDSPQWGRKRTLLLSSAISAIASLVLAGTTNLTTLVIGNLLMGFGIGLYWPATEAVVADLTEGQHRQEAYAVTRLADNLGLGMGIVLGGVLISITGAYRVLFVIDGSSFLVFFGVIYFAIAETYHLANLPIKSPPSTPRKTQKRFNLSLPKGWVIALSDRRMLIYVLVNIIFTTYISQTQSTLPLYLSKFVNSGQGLSEQIISIFFSWNLIISIICLIPVSRFLQRFSHVQALTLSALFWGTGFGLIWVTGIVTSGYIGWGMLAMTIFAIATDTYIPFASALVADIAPPSLRGIYISINSLCWAVGYFIGPPLGGWALDQSALIAHNFWLALSASIIIMITILYYLNQSLIEKG